MNGVLSSVAFVGLGSNLDDPASQVRRALDAMRAQPDLRLVRHSRMYLCAPWGPVEQPAFVNAVAQLETRLSPQRLLQRLLEIERALGRVRAAETRWGPRVIDLDLLMYDEVTCKDTRLSLPHPHLHERAFVLAPLNELAPRFVVPGRGPVADCLARIDASDCTPLED
jgi:2-amino-4-hydroxy-6-hydroxymethyldihydropteridine diphosphokinase